jgi:DNA mismatch repair protein MSH3
VRSGSTTLEYLVELKKRDAEGLEAAGKIDAKTWFVASETKDLRRYVAPAVGDLVDALRVARERAKLAARAAFGAVAADADARLSAPLRAALDLAALADALRALGALAREPGWALPALGGPAGKLSLRGLRHPTLVAEGGACVANDVELRAGDALVLTGPNAGGKSSIARAVALAHVFAQAGGPVPCERADVPLRDAIFTRMGAADDLAAGASTFLAELRRAALPLNEATAASFVILDELGRGTSTHDGVAVAAATLAHLVDEVRATTLFITHYHDLAKAAAADRARVRNVHVAYARVPRDDANDGFDDDIVMLYKLEPGLADASFGIYAARAAGVPPAVLDLARAKVGELRGAK